MSELDGMQRPLSVASRCEFSPLHSFPFTTERVHLGTVLPPLSPGFRGRGVGGEGQSASRRPSGPKLRTWPRVPTPVPRRRDRVFDGAAPSSPALLPREARGRREPEGFKINERFCQCESNESGLTHLRRSSQLSVRATVGFGHGAAWPVVASACSCRDDSTRWAPRAR